MTDPYRDSGFDVPVDAPRDPGIVGDVIAQFADPKAFYRELVQNAIDAGTPAIDIKLEYDDGQQRMRVSVRDRGCGMTRDIVETQLLVLFRSTKEQDKTKIGKFGIGFISVLAPNPEVVVVHTARDGRRLTLHLYRDLSYELFDAGPATHTGTTVELEIVVPRDQVAAFVRDSEVSLVRWCRHAAVPIELAVRTPDDVGTRRIDRPLSIPDVLVEVRVTADDGELIVVAGLKPNAAPYAGFFNHGLMLYETSTPLFGHYAVKIQDARLGHTISRDDVRRDEHFDHACEVARRVLHDQLAKAFSTALRDAAEAHDLERHQLLLAAYARTGSDLRLDYCHFPVVHAMGGKRSVALSSLALDVWSATQASQLTEALASEGTPVLYVRDATHASALLGQRVRVAERELTSIKPIDHTDLDEALIALMHELFDTVHRPPVATIFATLAGERAEQLAVAGKHAEVVHVVDRDEAARDPFALIRRRVLVLSVDHPQVRAARSYAARSDGGGDPVVAASHLARAVLLQHNLLDTTRSRKILDYALERVGVAR